MRIVVAPNAFKECLSAPAVAQAMADGVRAAFPEAEIVQVPLSDGGDGATEALLASRSGTRVDITAMDPLMRPVSVTYGLIDEGRTAVMEMAAVSGLWRLSEDEKNPLDTTTYGTGEMIRDALDREVETIVVGIGGSATTDAGIGMAAALGYRLLDSDGNELEQVGASMQSLERIDGSEIHPRLKRTKILIASDVTNPLLGPEGAAPVYGPQKGATPEMIPQLEDGLRTVATCWESDLNVTIGAMPGGGAAGGLGAGLKAFCDAELRSGFDLIADYAQLNEAMEGASLVITGEGRIDASTRFGKVPAGVGRRALERGIPAVVIAGSLDDRIVSLAEQGIISLFSICPGPVTLEEAMDRAADYLRQTAEQVVRLWRCHH